MLFRKKAGVAVSIHTTQKNCKLTEKEISTFKSQYGKLEIKFTDEFHDRFLILDNKSLYHIGASIKDAGKKAFVCNIMINDSKQNPTLSGRVSCFPDLNRSVRISCLLGEKHILQCVEEDFACGSEVLMLSPDYMHGCGQLRH